MLYERGFTNPDEKHSLFMYDGCILKLGGMKHQKITNLLFRDAGSPINVIENTP